MSYDFQFTGFFSLCQANVFPFSTASVSFEGMRSEKEKSPPFFKKFLV